MVVLASIFEKYRLFKHIFIPSDHAREVKEPYISYCSWIEKAVIQLDDKEQFLIQNRYLCNDADYITDQDIYKEKMEISEKTYSKVRNNAFNKLLINLQK